MTNGGGTGGDGGWFFFCMKGAARVPNAKELQGAGHFAGGPLPPSGRVVGLTAYKGLPLSPQPSFLTLSDPVKKKKRGEEKRRRGEALPDSDADFR